MTVEGVERVIARTEIDSLFEIIEFSHEEPWTDFDAMTTQHLGTSVEELVRIPNDGEFDEIMDVPFNHRRVGCLARLSRSVR